MPAFKDKLIQLSFEKTATHVVTFDPAVEMQTLQGRNGPYDAIPVDVDGKAFLLALGSSRLARQLKALGDGRKKISITRKGTGFETDYEVKVISK
jgi:hypothetical protein